jgi:CheY-like chemotaxis protein
MTNMRLLVVVDEPDVGEFVRAVAEDLGDEVTVTTRRNYFYECINR